MKKSFIALTLTLLLLVSLFTVSVSAEKVFACPHDHVADACVLNCQHVHDGNCGAQRKCTTDEHTHSWQCGFDLLTFTWRCGMEAHTHTDDCFEYTDDGCTHEHTDDCWICNHQHTDDECFVEVEEPANEVVSNLYPEYEEEAPAAPVVVDDDAVAPQTGDVISVTALVALMAAAAACVVFSARKVRG